MDGPLPWPAHFPLLVIRDNGVWVAPTEQRLTTMHRTIADAMCRGLLVDSDGRPVRLAGATEERPAGFWERWKQSQRHEIPVKLMLEGEPFRLTLYEVKALLFEALERRSEMVKSFMGLDRWRALERDVQAAHAFDEVIRLVQEFDTIPAELR